MRCSCFDSSGLELGKPDDDDRIQAGLNFVQSSESSRERVVFIYTRYTINIKQKCLQKSRRYVSFFSKYTKSNTVLLTHLQLVEFLHHGNTEIRQIGTFNRQKKSQKATRN